MKLLGFLCGCVFAKVRGTNFFLFTVSKKNSLYVVNACISHMIHVFGSDCEELWVLG